MTTTEFLAWHYYEPNMALNFLKCMIKLYIRYDVQTFHIKHQVDSSNETEQAENNEKCGLIKYKIIQSISVKKLEQKRDFKK